MNKQRQVVSDATVIIAGNSGDGSKTVGAQLTQTSAFAGNDISTLPDFPAEIRAPAGSIAGVSGFQLHFSSTDLHTPGDAADVLVAMNPAALKVSLPKLKPNGILIVKDNTTVGVGAGQVSRVDSVDIAMKKSGKEIKNSILCSDAFFPFRDSIDKIAGSGIKGVLQPGGSVRDDEVISACNEHGIAMVFTGQRCFKH